MIHSKVRAAHDDRAAEQVAAPPAPAGVVPKHLPLIEAQVLCGGNKKGVSQQRFYKQLIARADKIYKLPPEVLAAKKKAKPKQKGR